MLFTKQIGVHYSTRIVFSCDSCSSNQAKLTMLRNEIESFAVKFRLPGMQVWRCNSLNCWVQIIISGFVTLWEFGNKPFLSESILFGVFLNYLESELFSTCVSYLNLSWIKLMTYSLMPLALLALISITILQFLNRFFLIKIIWNIRDDCLFLYSWQMLISNITNIENLIRLVLHVKIVSNIGCRWLFSFSNFSDCRSNLVPFQKELTKKGN